MAYDKIITIRARLDDCLRYIQDGEKTALSLAMDYIEDSGKTTLDDEVILQSAINCTLETCYQDMQHTKERFGKPGGVVGYHLVHSYAPGETTPELAHEAAWNLHAVCSVTNMKPSFAPISTRNICTVILYSIPFHSWME